MTSPVSVFQGLAQETTLARVAAGELVLVQPRLNDLVSFGPVAPYVLPTGNEFSEMGVPGMVAVNGSATAYGAGAASGVRYKFWGRRIGLHFVETNAISPQPVDVFVDRRHRRTFAPQRREFTDTNATVDGGLILPIADDLAHDGPHWIEIVPSSGGTQQLYLLGFALERRMGYVQPQRVSTMQTAVTLTTSAAVIPRQGAGSAMPMRSIRALRYVNTDSVSHTVLLQAGTPTASTGTQTIATATVPAATTVNSVSVPGTAVVDFGDGIATDTTFKHFMTEAQATAPLLGFAIGRF